LVRARVSPGGPPGRPRAGMRMTTSRDERTGQTSAFARATHHLVMAHEQEVKALLVEVHRLQCIAGDGGCDTTVEEPRSPKSPQHIREREGEFNSVSCACDNDRARVSICSSTTLQSGPVNGEVGKRFLSLIQEDSRKSSLRADHEFPKFLDEADGANGKERTRKAKIEDLQATISHTLAARRSERMQFQEQPGSHFGRQDSNLSSKTHPRMIGNIQLDSWEAEGSMERFIAGPLEICMSFVIALNAVFLFLDFQYSGLEIGKTIGAVPASDIWEDHHKFFHLVDHAFQAFFLLEFFVRLFFLRMSFFYSLGRLDKFNLFDFAIVLLGCLHLYVFPLLEVNATNLAFFRLVRLARLSRTFKVVRVLKTFAKVRVLLGAVASSFLALSWSMLLLFILMFLAACFVTQLLQTHMEKGIMEQGMSQEAQESCQCTRSPDVAGREKELRDLWDLYGTSTRSFWTMFEITLGGQGTEPTKGLVNLHWSFTLFFLIYISGVVFAIICIIQALFLKDTLDVAADDAEAMVQEQMWKRKDTCAKLEEVFQAADTSGDGALSPEEFEDVLSIPQVRGYLELLELQVVEVQGLYNLLADVSGQIKSEEFVDGIMKLKGQARSMDIIAIMRDVKQILTRLDRIDAGCMPLTVLSDDHDVPRPSEKIATGWQYSMSLSPPMLEGSNYILERAHSVTEGTGVLQL